MVADRQVGIGKAKCCIRNAIVDVDVTGHKDFWPAVSIQVSDRGATLPAVSVDPGRRPPFGKGRVSIIPEEKIGPCRRHVNIDKPILIQITGNTPITAHYQGSTGRLADVDKAAISIVKQGAAGKSSCSFPGSGLILGVGVGHKKIEPAIIIDIKPAQPASHHGDRIARYLPTKGAMTEIETNLTGYISEKGSAFYLCPCPLGAFMGRGGTAGQPEEEEKYGP